MSIAREARRHDFGTEDQRTPFERDRDRIIYSSAFRRLAGITEIVRAGEDDVFHTRQQHTYKVAQVGRRLAQKCRKNQEKFAAALGVHEEVVEAACLAHDLGHPPFGHAGEAVLDKLVTQNGDDEGFEGNAQTFRVLTKLSLRFDGVNGLNLTRATLAACLKYPWFRNHNVASKSKKWSAYRSEAEDFQFCRIGQIADTKCAEAELMDWADDIAYSVHDLEDFHRCNVIPWNGILASGGFDELIHDAKNKWFDPPSNALSRLEKASLRLFALLNNAFSEFLRSNYAGEARQRIALRTLSSTLVGRYIEALALADPNIGFQENSTVAIKDTLADEMRLLKQITGTFVHTDPSLKAQQRGQEKIITDLFNVLFVATGEENEPPDFVPSRLLNYWRDKNVSKARIVADCISGLTETEAIKFHRRLFGIDSGSVLDPIAR